MTWAYSGNPSASNKDAVRFLVADTKAEEAYVTDEEILWALLQNNNIYAAAEIVSQAISAQFSTLADEEIGPLKFKYAERAKSYSAIAKRFGNLAATQQTMNIYCGGISKSDVALNDADTDRVTGMGTDEFSINSLYLSWSVI